MPYERFRMELMNRKARLEATLVPHPPGVWRPHPDPVLEADRGQGKLLLEEMKRTGRSLKEALNLAVRQSLVRDGAPKVVRTIFKASFPSEFLSQNMNQLWDELDDAKTHEELSS